MIGYLKHFNNNKTMYLMDIEFDSEPAYGDNNKYIKTKIKLYESKTITNFRHNRDRKNTKRKYTYKCLSLIMLESVSKTHEKYYPQTFLEECKYEIKKNKMENLFNDDLDPSSPDESDNKSDNESNNESNNVKSSD